MTIARCIAGVVMVIGLSIMPAFGKSNPTLFALENGIDSGQGNPTQVSLIILSLRIDIHAHGRLADVVVEAQIANMSDERDEGRFGLTLPANAVVTGYALDIDGRMIDGQLLEQPKARNVYEDEIRKGIDPGLAEVTAENRFQTRIFPIERGKPRTIRITFSAPFDPLDGFLLPLESDQPIARMQVDARIEGYKRPPQLLLGGVPLKLLTNGATWTVSQSYKNHRPAGNLSLSGGDPAAKLIISHHRKGMHYFQIGDAAPGRTMSSAQVDRLRIYWDRSLSRRDDLLAKEIDLLTAYVDAAHPSAIDLVTFASDTPTISHLADSGSLRDALTATVYRGGTDITDLDDLKLASADQCVLMSDGLLTIGSQAGFRPDCRLTIVSSDSAANGTALGRLANASQGQFVMLTESNGSDLLARLLKPAVAVVAARDDNGRRLAFRALPAATGGWFAVGEMPTSGNVHLLIAGLRKGLTERLYSVEGNDQATIDAPAVLWASQRALELADDPLSHDRMVKLARSYSVASPAMAFLVLERPDQYLQADIRPPAGFSAEWMADYRSAKKENDTRRNDEKAERLSFVIDQWAKRKDWWNKSFVPKPRQKNVPGSHAPTPPSPVTVAPPPAPVAAPYPQPRENAADEAFEDAASIIVTAQRVDNRVQDVPVSVTVISGKDATGKAITLDLANILSDQPYLKALDASSPAQRLTVFAEQEKVYGTLPAFYLETSEWFRLKGEAATAEALLYSALELPTADDETRQVVAFRLQRAGHIDRAIAMLEKIAVTSDFRPQPKRGLALALAERGRTRGKAGRVDLERAFILLTDVALDPAIRDFDGIEVIALMEANSLVPFLEEAGGQWSLDPRLVGLLDTDVRIVIEWTNDDADIDLWVIEPNGEKVYYGYQTSSAGGTISNDMTDGYGPEEYAIRRAPNGEYAIRINGYDADRLNPNGNGRVMVRMIRDFGRPAMKETLVDADIAFEKGRDRNQDGGKLIARMVVGNSKR